MENQEESTSTLDRAPVTTKALWFLLNAVITPAAAVTYVVSPKGKQRTIYRLHQNLENYLTAALSVHVNSEAATAPPDGRLPNGEFVVKGFLNNR